MTCLQAEKQKTAVFKYQRGKQVYVEGIAGLQYAAFFSHLLPAYAEFGVPGATELLDLIIADGQRDLSVHELNRLYRDENVMTSVPMEV